MSAETEISNVGMTPNSTLEEMSSTDESIGANPDDQTESSWETPKPVTTAPPSSLSSSSSYPIVNNKPFNSQPEKIPLKVPGNVLTTTSVASAAAAAALASAAADAAAAAAAMKNNPSMHTLAHSNGIMDKPYKCETCDKAFSLNRALKAHKRVHTAEKPFKCDTCPKAFNHQGALKAHKRVHTGERPFKCDMCEMSFSHRSTLITHRRTHTGEKPFKCDLCDKVFSYRQTMKSHRKKHPVITANMSNTTGMIGTSTASSTLGIDLIAKRQLFKCMHCGKECCSRDELDAHIETHSEKKQQFRCFTCNKTFSNCDTLEKHKITHLNLHVTKSGNLLAANSTDLTERIAAGVVGQDTNGDLSINHFSSSSPSSSFPPSISSQQQTPQHQQQHLLQQQQQQQQQFPKKKLISNNNINSSSSSNGSTLGTDRIHIEERPYKCCICNEGFPTITTLTNHERTHNDDTSMSLLSSSLLSSYTCDTCGVVFSEKSNLDAHKKMHIHEKPFDYKPITVTSQKDYTDSPFECTICGAFFSNNMWSSSA